MLLVYLLFIEKDAYRVKVTSFHLKLITSQKSENGRATSLDYQWIYYFMYKEKVYKTILDTFYYFLLKMPCFVNANNARKFRIYRSAWNWQIVQALIGDQVRSFITYNSKLKLQAFHTVQLISLISNRWCTFNEHERE